MQFYEMGLDETILSAIDVLGFDEPTAIQEKVIPQIMGEKGDVIALAQTGTGKTAGFGLPLVQKIDPHKKNVQSLVLCPTRELCMQITNDIRAFSKKKKGFSVIPVYGGAPIDKQINQLKKGVQMVVGTPGRTRDLIERGILNIEQVEWLVLDEADEMLQMGFKEELDAILEGVPPQRKTMLFSATMPKEVLRIANQYMHQPVEISVGAKNAGAEHVSHIYYMTHAKYRYDVLKRIADMHPEIYGIVFCRTRQETKQVADKLMNDGYDADALHGDLSQAQRDLVMNRFRKKQLQMLIATDVAARGLDVNDLTHVINYNLPDDPESYIHRSGRTGRAGKKGVSISIIHTRETGKIRGLEKITKKKFTREMVPAGQEICKKQLFNLVSRMENVETGTLIDEFLPEIYKKLEWMSKEDLIKNFVSVEFNRFLEYYKQAPDLNAESERRNNERRDPEQGRRDQKYWDQRQSDQRPRAKKRSNRSDISVRANGSRTRNYSRFYINIGSKNDMNPTRLIGLLLDTTKDKGIDIGKIDIMKGFSFFEADRRNEEKILKSFNKRVRRNGQLIKVEIAGDDPHQKASLKLK